MAWYVFALVDTPPRRRVGNGFAAPLVFKRVAGGFAASERRADVPPVEMDALKQHDRIVTKLWNEVPAILPVRFGTLLELEDLSEMLADRDDDLANAFDAVRDCGQFTWRNLRPTAPRPVADRASSGAAYLRRAAGLADTIPRRYGAIRKPLAPYVRRERFQPAVAPRPERLYHLVLRDDVPAYRSVVKTLSTRDGFGVTGPWPPYAFAPEML